MKKNYGIIKYSYQTKEIAIKNFLKHSIVKGGKPVEDCLKKEIAQVKDKTLLQFIIARLEHCSNLNDTVKKIIAYIKDNDNVNDNDNDNDNDNERYVDVSYNDSYHDSLEESNNVTKVLPKCYPYIDIELDKELDIEKDNLVPSVNADEPTPTLFLTLRDGSQFSITNQDISKYQEVYTKIDVKAEIKKMVLWCDSDPAKRKTKTGIKRFVNLWLNNANDKQIEQQTTSQQKKENKHLHA